MQIIPIAIAVVIGAVVGVGISDFNFASKNLTIDEQQGKINQLSEQQSRKDNEAQKFCNLYFKEEN